MKKFLWFLMVSALCSSAWAVPVPVPVSVPDGGSTLALLGGAFALLGVAGRKIRK